jgi:hypothetical protein
MTAEQQRLNDNAAKDIPLELWGPYLSERQWGTVREDYSEGGDAWNYFTHDQSRSRVYRWGEDGLGGICDYSQRLCFALALWNGKDPILKERLFGLTNGEGNHGEDVKELYYYLDNVPSHYYMKYLYKYPQAIFPYDDLVEKNRNRTREEPEYEILDTGVFNDNKYFDVCIEYAKQLSEDIFIRITVTNRYHDTAPVTILPTLWFYNSWQYKDDKQKPVLQQADHQTVTAVHKTLGEYFFYFLQADEVLFTENETNNQKLFGKPNETDVVKDAFHTAVINGENRQYIASRKQGTKCSPMYQFDMAGNASKSIYLRLSATSTANPFPDNFETIFSLRKGEADDFYKSVLPANMSVDMANIQRQAFAGLLWNKQYYHYDVERWLHTSDGISPIASSRLAERNYDWKNIKAKDVLLMPDKWEYPWFAAWDLAFHCISMAHIDPVYAKHQILILLREWYMNPGGQVPAYEWNFSDVNPPVQAFAALRVYEIEKERKGKGDIQFLKKVFQKLVINFTWWVNRKDFNGNNIFEGGFLGLDNIGVFNRNMKLPGEINLEQTDGTSWMGMYALNMMDIAIEIAMHDDAFEDMATKFYEHFMIIADALNELGLWSEADHFYYDVLLLDGMDPFPLQVRSMVGLIPLFAVSVNAKENIAQLPDFKKRLEWFTRYRIANGQRSAESQQDADVNILFSLVSRERLNDLLQWVLREDEFLSVGGIRALSKYYQGNPYRLCIGGENYDIAYNPADSTSGLFGGNSNWRGPVWMPMNYLLIRSMHKYGDFYGDSFTIEFPKGSGQHLNLHQVADMLRERMLGGFEVNDKKERAIYGYYNWFYQQPGNEGLVLFFEYFDGDTQRGLGASHQTGWTALITDMLLNTRPADT